jgi:hypothetical protein
MVVVILLLTLGVCVVAVTFRGTPPRWVMALCAVCLAAFLALLVCGLIYGLVHSRGAELVLPTILAVLLAGTLVLVLRCLGQPSGSVLARGGQTRGSGGRA